MCPVFIFSYKNYGSGPTKYPLADVLQFVLEFATTKPTSVSPAEDLRPNSSSPTPASHPLSEPISKDNRLSTQRIRELHRVVAPDQRQKQNNILSTDFYWHSINNKKVKNSFIVLATISISNNNIILVVNGLMCLMAVFYNSKLL